MRRAMYLIMPLMLLPREATSQKSEGEWQGQLDVVVLGHFLRCGESYFAEQHLVLTTGEVSERSLGTWEFRGYKSDFSFRTVSEADRLNGIAWRGIYRYQWTAQRQRTPGVAPSRWIEPGVSAIEFQMKDGKLEQLNERSLRGTMPAACPDSSTDAALFGAHARARVHTTLMRAVGQRSQSLLGTWEARFRGGAMARLTVADEGDLLTARMLIVNGKSSELEETLSLVPSVDGDGFVLQGRGYEWKKKLTGIGRLLASTPDAWDVGTYAGTYPGSGSELRLRRTNSAGDRITWHFKRTQPAEK